jgi:hypothetical protein
VAGYDGRYEVGQQELARRLGASRTTLQRALGELAAAGAWAIALRLVRLRLGKANTLAVL